MLFNCKLASVDTDKEHPRILQGCRESALRASRAMGRGAAQGRGRPSDDG